MYTESVYIYVCLFIYIFRKRGKIYLSKRSETRESREFHYMDLEGGYFKRNVMCVVGNDEYLSVKHHGEHEHWENGGGKRYDEYVNRSRDIYYNIEAADYTDIKKNKKRFRSLCAWRVLVNITAGKHVTSTHAALVWALE